LTFFQMVCKLCTEYFCNNFKFQFVPAAVSKIHSQTATAK